MTGEDDIARSDSRRYTTGWHRSTQLQIQKKSQNSGILRILALRFSEFGLFSGALQNFTCKYTYRPREVPPFMPPRPLTEIYTATNWKSWDTLLALFGSGTFFWFGKLHFLSTLTDHEKGHLFCCLGSLKEIRTATDQKSWDTLLAFLGYLKVEFRNSEKNVRILRSSGFWHFLQNSTF